MQLFVMPLPGKQDSCSQVPGNPLLSLHAWFSCLSLLPPKIWVQSSYSASELRDKTRVLETHSVFINMSIFSPGFGGHHRASHPSLTVPGTTVLWCDGQSSQLASGIRCCGPSCQTVAFYEAQYPWSVETVWLSPLNLLGSQNALKLC